MWVIRVLGDCPGCQGKNCFGNVSVQGDHVLRGCTQCKYCTNIWLPEIRKDCLSRSVFLQRRLPWEWDRFVNAAKRIRHLSDLQLLVASFSSIHEEETHQWRGFGGKNKDNLMEFIKATSRGHKFSPAYDVEQKQINRAFKAFLAGSPRIRSQGTRRSKRRHTQVGRLFSHWCRSIHWRHRVDPRAQTTVSWRACRRLWWLAEIQ